MPAHEPVAVPGFLYGTAWKEDAPRPHRTRAPEQGSAASTRPTSAGTTSRPASASGLAAAYRAGWSRATTCFLQTKFTFRHGQDHRLPYDPGPISPLRSRSRSPARSNTSGPTRRLLRPARPRIRTRLDRGRLRGVAGDGGNTTPADARFSGSATSRCAARAAGASAVRETAGASCRTAATRAGLGPRRSRVLPRARTSSIRASRCSPPTSEVLATRSRRHRRPPGHDAAQVVFRFARAVGMLPLTGTTDPTTCGRTWPATTCRSRRRGAGDRSYGRLRPRGLVPRRGRLELTHPHEALRQVRTTRE